MNLMNTIHEIRKSLGYSQEKLAKELGVSFASVNRWENEKTIPSKLVQEKLFDICINNNLDLLSIVENRINEETVKNNKTILYHGSKNGIVGSIKPISRDRCDFGSGFYMGDNPIQPLTLISDFKDSKFYIVSIDLVDLKLKEIPLDLDWAMIIAYNRGLLEDYKDTKFYKKYEGMFIDYDLAVGYIANDRMFVVLDNFFKGTLTDKGLLKCLSALKLGKQYVALTNKATSKIKIEKEIELLWLEKEVIKQRSEENRNEGINLANKISKDYRRQGKFFDELLKDYK